MKRTLTVLVILILLASSATSLLRPRKRMDMDITGIDADMLCIYENVIIDVYDRNKGTPLEKVDIDIYYDNNKIISNKKTNSTGQYSFIVDVPGPYRITVEKSRYYDNEIDITVFTCTPTTSTSILVCPEVISNPILEENCIQSGGTLVKRTSPTDCAFPPECLCDEELSENWTCGSLPTTSVTTTITQRQIANDLFNKSFGYYTRGDYNQTRKYVLEACSIYENISDSQALAECDLMLENLRKAFETTSIASTTVPEIIKPKKTSRTEAVTLILSVLIILALGSLIISVKRPKKTKLGGRHTSIRSKHGGTKLEG